GPRGVPAGRRDPEGAPGRSLRRPAPVLARRDVRPRRRRTAPDRAVPGDPRGRRAAVVPPREPPGETLRAAAPAARGPWPALDAGAGAALLREGPGGLRVRQRGVQELAVPRLRRRPRADSHRAVPDRHGRLR